MVTAIADTETTALDTGAATEVDIEDELAEHIEDERTTEGDIMVEEGIWAGITLITGEAVEEEAGIRRIRGETAIGGTTTKVRGPRRTETTLTKRVIKKDIKKDTTVMVMGMVQTRGLTTAIMDTRSRCTEEATGEDIKGHIRLKTEAATMGGRNTSQNTDMEAIWDGMSILRRLRHQNQRHPSIRAPRGPKHLPTHGLLYSK